MWRSCVGVLRGCAVEHFPQLHANFHVARAVSLGVSDLLRREVRVYSSAHLEPLVANMGNDRRHASAWFEWRSRGWLSLGLGFEYRTGSGSSTLTPDPSSALLEKSPQADIVRRTIITDDRRRCSSRWTPGESRAVEARLRGFEGTSRRLWMRRGTHEVRRGHMGGKD